MIQGILAQLYEDRKLLEEAILSLEQLANGRKRGRGRPRNRLHTWLQNEQTSQVASASAAD